MFSAQVRRRLALATAVLAVTAASACGSGEGDSASENDGAAADVAIDPQGSLAVGTITVPTGFDPHRERSGGERPYTFLVFDRLTKIGAEMQVEPMLATDWEFSEDGLAMTMNLRDDVTFHDGTAFDATAVQANVQRAKTVQGSTVTDELALVESVEVVSPTEARFVLSAPAPELPQLLAGPAGAMVSPAALADGRDLVADPGDAGSGPYLVETFVPSEGVTFVRAEEQSWDENAGRLAELEVRLVGDDRTRNSALRAGELDIIYVNPLDANGITEAQALADGGEFAYHSSPTDVLQALLLRSSLLTDERVRQAIVHAIDRETIAENLLRGTCEPSGQLTRKGFVGHIENFEDPYPYDPAAARELLDEAGVADGSTLDISFIAGREAIPEVEQAQLAEVGIEASLTPLTSIEVLTAFRSDQAQSWNYQVASELSPSATMDFVLSPAGVGGASPEIQAAVDEARTILDDDERAAAHQETRQMLAEEAFFVPLCHIDAHYLMTDRVVDFDTAPVPYAQYMLDLRYLAEAQE
jgi:peptide/nickel transport system substrate-binding protein